MLAMEKAKEGEDPFKKFRRNVYYQIERGQRLGVADKLIVNQVIDDFWQTYTLAGGIPYESYNLVNVSIIADTLRDYGFIMPLVRHFNRHQLQQVLHELKKGDLGKYESLRQYLFLSEEGNRFKNQVLT